MHPFSRLTAWQVAHELVLAIYLATASWPSSEKFGLISQIRRAASSVACNISEGSGKRTEKEFRRYLDIAIGSMAEVTYLLILGRDLKYLSNEDFQGLEDIRNRAGKLTWGLYQAGKRVRKV